MPEYSATEAAARIADLIRQALALADRAGIALVAIHLDEALQALERPPTDQ